jgi:hypothetical protein
MAIIFPLTLFGIWLIGAVIAFFAKAGEKDNPRNVWWNKRPIWCRLKHVASWPFWLPWVS